MYSQKLAVGRSNSHLGRPADAQIGELGEGVDYQL